MAAVTPVGYVVFEVGLDRDAAVMVKVEVEARAAISGRPTLPVA